MEEKSVNLLRKLTVLSTTAMAAAALVVIPAGSASAATGCWYSNGNWWCNNVSGAAVYGFRNDTAREYPDPSRIVGRMYSNPSWFECRHDGTDYVGGPHPYRWVWTEADNGQWGWMKDTSIYSETDPLPVCW
jgi:hypothetical protein